ncbi:MAG: tetratricopeptide repeat protein [Candidatus Kapabacteria bacterium]|nr:tetratricopeptide repeat protein [Ignavibacteriota bacterium]MCW5886053.1 tetratricopeptide repeat protein [Candidatus Kapabacteria bacterium]
MSDISLMFAVEAEQLLLADLPEDAIELCNKGLEIYPGYAAALSVLAKAHKALGEKNIALQIIDDSQYQILAPSYEIIHKSVEEDAKLEDVFIEDNFTSNSEFVNPAVILNSDVADIQKDYVLSDSPEDDDEKYSFDSEDILNLEDNIEVELSDNFDSVANNDDTILDSSNFEIASDETINIADSDLDYQPEKFAGLNSKSTISASNIDLIPGLHRFQNSRLQSLFTNRKKRINADIYKIISKQSQYISLISSLSHANPIKPDSHHKGDRKKTSVIVTETIADILVKQGAYEEAKVAYKELSKKYPEKKKQFDKIIANINKKLI